MTPQIQSQPVKSLETPSRDTAPGFLLPVVPYGSDTPSFDSFISKEHQDDPRAKELEEEEKEKKRIKAEQLASALAPSLSPTNTASTTDEASLLPPQTDAGQTSETSQPTHPKPDNHDDISSKQQKLTDSFESAKNEPSQAAFKESDQADIQKEPDAPTDPIASGTDHAASSEDMISLAAMDSLDAGLPAVVPKDPSITTSGRLNSFTVADRIATSSALTPSASSNSESNLGQTGTGGGAPMPSVRPTSAPKSPEATASSMLRSLRVEVEKFTQANRSQLQLELPISDTESVKVRLSMRGNELHTVFVTGSADLREALQKAWPEFSQTSRDRGFNFNDPSFQQSANNGGTPYGDPQDRRRTADTTPAPATAPLSKPRKAASPQPSTRPGGVSLWA